MQKSTECGILVQKYGGSSIATSEMILQVADRIRDCRKDFPKIAVAVSAMGKTTDQLVSLANQVSEQPRGREMDLLLASGEQIAVSLLGLALQAKGIKAISLTAAQCGIQTDGVFNRAKVRSIDTRRLVRELETGNVVIVTGFQGITKTDEVTTLGRGGGDITGAALAAALEADVCEICTDVDGVFSADPSVVQNARLLKNLSYEEAVELASSGAKVLHPRAAEICMRHNIPIHVRSSSHRQEGTWIRGGTSAMEEAEVVGVSSDNGLVKVTLRSVPDKPGVAARIFQDLADADINVRLIIQNAGAQKQARITFILELEYLESASNLFEKWCQDGITSDSIIERDVATISIIGSRLSSTPGLAARMFAVLHHHGINIDCISSSEMKISCVIAGNHLKQAVQIVHEEFFDSQEIVN